MSLVSLIAERAQHEEIAAYLDGLSESTRLTQVLALRRHQQRDLYDCVANAPAISLDHFVPEEIRPGEEVIHFGKNTIPIPHRLRHFQKRFCLPPSNQGPQRLFGYNEGFSRKWIGPGYFVAETTDTRPEWQERGNVVVDYFQIPNQAVPVQWPQVIPNHQGLQKFVFDRTRDFMRRVSTHVSVGAAYREEKALGFFFVLCRRTR